MIDKNIDQLKRLKLRKNAEMRLKVYGILSISLALIMLATLMISIGLSGYSALQQAYVKLEINVDSKKVLDEKGGFSNQKALLVNWDGIVSNSFITNFPEITKRSEKRSLRALMSSNAGYELRQYFQKNPDDLDENITIWLSASDDFDQYMKGRFNTSVDEKDRRLSNQQLKWIDFLAMEKISKLKFNTSFFVNADSREPESAGILGAVVGSTLTLTITILFALPLAVMASVYLEYFAKPGRLTDFIEVNINNLAAIPSIVFGLLGLSVFLGFFGLPRSAPLVGGLCLGLMTIPTIIIASRASIRAVPPSIKDAALALGASRMQAALHHVLPLAAPGILTGTIIGMAQALGETAPLLMIGMVAFIIETPDSFTSAATAMPVQIFMWSDSAERAFYERSSLAILFLVGFLIIMNSLAVFLRRKFEKKW
jgi:phosphate transport system permease protein|tara:strand:- start:2437 stop:3717 length:1281 start_codon:yes stop_codon:yes gene_type:complete